MIPSLLYLTLLGVSYCRVAAGADSNTPKRGRRAPGGNHSRYPPDVGEFPPRGGSGQNPTAGGLGEHQALGGFRGQLPMGAFSGHPLPLGLGGHLPTGGFSRHLPIGEFGGYLPAGGFAAHARAGAQPASQSSSSVNNYSTTRHHVNLEDEAHSRVHRGPIIFPGEGFGEHSRGQGRHLRPSSSASSSGSVAQPGPDEKFPYMRTKPVSDISLYIRMMHGDWVIGELQRTRDIPDWVVFPVQPGRPKFDKYKIFMNSVVGMFRQEVDDTAIYLVLDWSDHFPTKVALLADIEGEKDTYVSGFMKELTNRQLTAVPYKYTEKKYNVFAQVYIGTKRSTKVHMFRIALEQSLNKRDAAEHAADEVRRRAGLEVPERAPRPRSLFD